MRLVQPAHGMLQYKAVGVEQMTQDTELDDCTMTGEDIGKPQKKTHAEPELTRDEWALREIAGLKAELAEANAKLKDMIPKSKVQEVIMKIEIYKNNRLNSKCGETEKFGLNRCLNLVKELLSDEGKGGKP